LITGPPFDWIPTRTKRLELKNENVGGMEFSVPLVGGGFKIAGSGSYCLSRRGRSADNAAAAVSWPRARATC
jgi:hypothetical protein